MKAQASTEMMAVYGSVMLVFVFLLFLFSGQIPVVIGAKNSMDSFQAASDLGAAINAIYLAGDGANTTINLGHVNAEIIIDGRALDVKVGNAFSDWPLLTNRTSAPSNISTDDLVIKNSKGVVYIENA